MNSSARFATIKAVEFALPKKILTNEMLCADFPAWSVEKIEEKTGIKVRHIAADHETVSDLGVLAAEKLFANHPCSPDKIDFVLFCTQTPDYILPSTACLVQHRLGIPTTSGALDFNLGCSGFVYGLGLAKGLIETGQAENVLLITAETYSKLIHPEDKSVRTLFGDAAAATWIGSTDDRSVIAPMIGPFVYGSDGSGGENLMVPHGGMRHPVTQDSCILETDDDDNKRTKKNLYMNGAEIFAFTLKSVPKALRSLLERAGLSMEEIDLFVFHQANQFMLEHLRKKIKINTEKFHISFTEYGNTVSSTIPIGLWTAQQEGKLRHGSRVALVGFGVGYSWAATMIRWPS
ncbi:MAG: ketoacyl-ACP synthase III [Magnetococcus sp. YQC-5]